MKSLRKHAFGSPRKGGGQEDQLADPEHQGELLQLLKARRPLILRPSPAPQLIAANSSTHFKAAIPHQVLAWSFLDKQVATPSASTRRSCPLCFSGNATPGTHYAAAVRPQPCLASWEPVFAGVMLRCAGVLRCEHAREREPRQCGLRCSKRTWHPLAVRCWDLVQTTCLSHLIRFAYLRCAIDTVPPLPTLLAW